MEKCAAWRTFFEFISANTCVYFGKYAHVFPQIFLRISANKFGAGLKKRCFVPSGDSLRFVPDGDMYTSLTGTRACPRCGSSHALGADTGMSKPRTRKDLCADAENNRVIPCHSLLASFPFLCNHKNNRKQDNYEDDSEAHLNKWKYKIVIFFFLVHLCSAIHFAFVFCL